jgi:hypothetical protein
LLRADRFELLLALANDIGRWRISLLDGCSGIKVADSTIIDSDEAPDIPRRTAACSDGMDRGDSIVVSTTPCFKTR